MEINLFKDITPSWEILGFDQGKDHIPVPRCWPGNSFVHAEMIGNHLTFRVFEGEFFSNRDINERTEMLRYVFTPAGIIREEFYEWWNFVTAQTILEENRHNDTYEDQNI